MSRLLDALTDQPGASTKDLATTADQRLELLRLVANGTVLRVQDHSGKTKRHYVERHWPRWTDATIGNVFDYLRADLGATRTDVRRCGGDGRRNVAVLDLLIGLGLIVKSGKNHRVLSALVPVVPVVPTKTGTRPLPSAAVVPVCITQPLNGAAYTGTRAGEHTGVTEEEKNSGNQGNDE